MIPLAGHSMLVAAAGFLASLVKSGSGLGASVAAGLCAILAVIISVASTAGAAAVTIDSVEKARVEARQDHLPVSSPEAATVQPQVDSQELESIEPVPAEQPVTDDNERPVKISPPPLDVRTWSSASGGYSIEAEFVTKGARKVKLRKPDGTIVQINYANLSPADREWIAARGDRIAP